MSKAEVTSSVGAGRSSTAEPPAAAQVKAGRAQRVRGRGRRSRGEGGGAQRGDAPRRGRPRSASACASAMQGGDALQCLDPCHPAARVPDRGYGHAASTRPLPLQTARYETRLETPTFGRAAPSRLRSPPPRARCLLGSVVHAARLRAAADYASRQAARPRRGGGGRAAVAERTNGRGRCSLVSAGAGGPPPGPLAVREFRTGRKERRPGLGAEEVFEAGV